MKTMTNFLAFKIEKDPSLISGIQDAELQILLSQLIYGCVYQFGCPKWKIARNLGISLFTLRRILDGDVPYEGEELLRFAENVLGFYRCFIGEENSEANREIQRMEEIVRNGNFGTEKRPPE